jgi:putative lipoic acid-binding regulatory protein
MSHDKDTEDQKTKKINLEESITPERTTLMEYPCDFLIKMMGKNNEAFVEKAKAIIHECFPDQISTMSFKEVPSKDNTYLAISVKIIAKNQSDLDKCYQALTAEPLVLIAL